MHPPEDTVIDALGRRRHFHGTPRKCALAIQRSCFVRRGSCFGLAFCTAAKYASSVYPDDDPVVMEIWLRHDQFDGTMTKRENFWLRDTTHLTGWNKGRIHEMAALGEFCPHAV